MKSMKVYFQGIQKCIFPETDVMQVITFITLILDFCVKLHDLVSVWCLYYMMLFFVPVLVSRKLNTSQISWNLQKKPPAAFVQKPKSSAEIFLITLTSHVLCSETHFPIFCTTFAFFLDILYINTHACTYILPFYFIVQVVSECRVQACNCIIAKFCESL